MFARVEFQADAGLYNEFLNWLLENNYILFNIIRTQFGFRAVCYAEDYRNIALAGRRFQCRVRISDKKGIFFLLRKIKYRKGLFYGTVLFFALTYLFSNIIWDIEIHTDDKILKNEIAARLYRHNITAGSFYSEEKLDSAEKRIIFTNNDLSYISLNFYKGLLECHINTKTRKKDYISDLSENDIFSKMSGVITDLRVYTGYSQVELGQSISQGDILVSHTVTDIYGNTYHSNTRAYIEALCDKTYSVFIPFSKKSTVLTGLISNEIYLEFLNNKICIQKADTALWQDCIEKVRTDYLSIAGFHLPVTVRTVSYYQLADVMIESDTLTARNIAKLQLQHMIENDSLLKNETNRIYDYVLKQDGLQMNCIVTGHYQIT